MDNDGDTRRKTKQDKTNKTEKSDKTKNKQTKLTKTRNKNKCMWDWKGATGRRGGNAYIERAKSQNLPKMTHFCHEFFVLTRGGNGSRVSEPGVSE